MTIAYKFEDTTIREVFRNAVGGITIKGDDVYEPDGTVDVTLSLSQARKLASLLVELAANDADVIAYPETEVNP